MSLWHRDTFSDATHNRISLCISTYSSECLIVQISTVTFFSFRAGRREQLVCWISSEFSCFRLQFFQPILFWSTFKWQREINSSTPACSSVPQTAVLLRIITSYSTGWFILNFEDLDFGQICFLIFLMLKCWKQIQPKSKIQIVKVLNEPTCKK